MWVQYSSSESESNKPFFPPVFFAAGFSFAATALTGAALTGATATGFGFAAEAWVPGLLNLKSSSSSSSSESSRNAGFLAAGFGLATGCSFGFGCTTGLLFGVTGLSPAGGLKSSSLLLA